MTPEHVRYDVDPPVATITLNRPDRLNALAVQTWDEFRSCLEQADGDDDVRVVVLAGAGRAFCSGDDIGDLDFDTAGDAWAYARFIIECGLTIDRIDTPVVSKVDGLAFGGGCELAVLPDVTIASEDATFRMPESLIGAVPGIGLARFPELIGLKRTRELFLTNRELSANDAYDIGLVNEVVPADEIDETVAERAADIAATAPVATRLIKRTLNGRLEDSEEGIGPLSFALMTEDMKEGMEAFFGDHDPVWQDR